MKLPHWPQTLQYGTGLWPDSHVCLLQCALHPSPESILKQDIPPLSLCVPLTTLRTDRLIRWDRMSHAMSEPMQQKQISSFSFNYSSTYIKSFFGTTNSSPILRRSHSSFLVLIFRGLSVRWFRWSFFSFYSKGDKTKNRENDSWWVYLEGFHVM